MGSKSPYGIVLCAALVVALTTVVGSAPSAAGLLPATGGFINFSTLLLIAGGVLLVVVGAVAYAILSRRGTRE